MRKNQSFTPVRQPYEQPVTEIINMDLQSLAAGSPLYVLGGWVVDGENPWESTPVEIESEIWYEDEDMEGGGLGGWVVSNVDPWE